MNCLHAVTIWICSYKGLSKRMKGNLIYDIMMKMGRESDNYFTGNFIML